MDLLFFFLAREQKPVTAILTITHECRTEEKSTIRIHCALKLDFSLLYNYISNRYVLVLLRNMVNVLVFTDMCCVQGLKWLNECF